MESSGQLGELIHLSRPRVSGSGVGHNAMGGMSGGHISMIPQISARLDLQKKSHRS
jgi:hypothetical protein